MNHWKRAVFGPELIWLVLWGITLLVVAPNQPPTEAGNLRLEAIGYYLSLGGPLLSFLGFALPAPGKWWLLGRTLLAGIIGLPIMITALCKAIDYHDSRNSGIGMGWMLYLSLGFMVLGGGALVAVLVLFGKWLAKRNRPSA